MGAPVDVTGGGVVVSIECSLSQLRFDRTTSGALRMVLGASSGKRTPMVDSVKQTFRQKNLTADNADEHGWKRSARFTKKPSGAYRKYQPATVSLTPS